MLKVWGSYRLSETLQPRGHDRPGAGHVLGHRLLAPQPGRRAVEDQRLSPFFGIGVGRFKQLPEPEPGGRRPTNANLANAAVGVRYYLTDRFVLRADYSLYTVFVNDHADTGEYRAWTPALSFFF